jgi:sensor c-di-GMP phosphodiesterase-like protein
VVTALGTVVVVVEVVLVVVVSAGLMQPTTGTVETAGSADGAHRIGRLVEVVVVAAEAVNAGAQKSHNRNTTSEDISTVRRIVSTLVIMCPC